MKSRKNYKGADWVFYLPADTKANAKRFISIVNPIKVILLSMNFGSIIWLNLIKKIFLFIQFQAIFRKDNIFLNMIGLQSNLIM